MTKSNIRNQNELDDELWGEIPPDPIYSHGLSLNVTRFGASSTSGKQTKGGDDER